MLATDLNHFFFVALFVNIIVGMDLEVGESCQPRLGSSDEGKCLLITECPEAIRYIRTKGMHPFQRCGFLEVLEIVCCPSGLTTKNPTQSPTSSRHGDGPRILERQCKKISQETTPPLDLHIIGGVDAEFAEFPHMAALGFLRGDDYDFSCGGSLISENYILTAAHCVDNVDKIKPSIARLGVVQIGENRFNSSTDVRISDIIPYPSRTPLYKYHDLALLKLEKPVEFRHEVVPACVYTEESLPTVPLTVSGWGRIDVAKDIRGKILQKANVSVVDSAECSKNYENWRKMPEGIKQGQFCAGDPHGRTDACQGDSGGPIQAMSAKDGHYRIVGVISFGRGCASPVPGVYTRLHPYLDWIESVVWPNGL